MLKWRMVEGAREGRFIIHRSGVFEVGCRICENGETKAGSSH
jgi:hypothetical protein